MNRFESPNQSSRGGKKPLMLIIHGTGSLNEEGTVGWIMNRDSKVSYHYVIGRDGSLVQLVAETERAWHAGKSQWPELGFPHKSLNAWSIGIGLVNDGSAPYHDAQYKAAGMIAADIAQRWKIPLPLIRGHNEVSPGRKIDPYEHWDWHRFYGHLGMAAAGRG